MSLKKGGVALLIMLGLGVLSFVLYTLVLSWEFAILLIGSLVFHEYGHLWAAKRVGLETKGIYLIPFVGGVALSKGKPPSQAAWVFVALAGPAFGFALALATALAYVVTGWSVLAAAAWWMALLNLFNLIPIYPLDGGQVMHCIACSVPRSVGIAICGASVLLAGGLAFFGPFLLGLLILWMAGTGFGDFVWGRTRRERQRTILEEMERRLREGSATEGDRFFLWVLLRESSEWGPPSTIPSAASLLPHVQAKIEELREPPPLHGGGIAASVAAYLLLGVGLAILFALTVTIPGALEGLLQILGVSAQ